MGGLPGWDHLSVIFSVIYLLVRRLLGCLMVLARREVSKDAELLVLRHEKPGVVQFGCGPVKPEL